MKTNNSNITCWKSDKNAILRLKKYLNYRNTNEVVEMLLNKYLNSGELSENEKPVAIGKAYYKKLLESEKWK